MELVVICRRLGWAITYEHEEGTYGAAVGDPTLGKTLGPTTALETDYTTGLADKLDKKLVVWRRSGDKGGYRKHGTRRLGARSCVTTIVNIGYQPNNPGAQSDVH